MPATNAVFIAIDDLFAYTQFRDSFGVTIETPNLDRLMERSVNFENAYAAVAICAPSRAATMTGQTPFQTGAHDNFTYVFDTVDPQQTWPALIRDNGYFATSSGKVFHSKASDAVQSVYSEPIIAASSTLKGDVERTEGGRPWEYLGPDEDFSDNKVATFGIEFLDRAPEDQPFLLTLGFDHPHTSYKAPARFYDLYPFDEIQVPTSWVQGDLSDAPAFAQQFTAQPRGGEPFSNLQAWKTTVQGYLASISHMDAEVGRFLDALAASEHADDTAIVVYSDHGYQLGNKDHPVKFTLWEESAKAPLMIYHPDGAQGATVSTPVSLMDIMPTMLDLTGTAIPEGLVGQSLLTFVTGDGSGYQEKPALTSMYGSFGIRSGDYRYIRYVDGSEELYDVVTDPGQITNLAVLPEYRALADQMRVALLEAARESGAVIDEDVAILTGTDGSDQGVASPTNDVIALGLGDDSYQIFGNTSRIVEQADGGFDTVYYVGTEAFRMPENVERFFITVPDNRLGVVSAIGNDGDEEFHTGYTSGLIYGGGGDDDFYGGGWVNHTFYGGDGQDELTGWKYNDQLYGDSGDDILNSWDRNDALYGGEGEDLLNAGRGNDALFGGAGDDRLNAGDGDDLIFGGAGVNVISTGTGRDVVVVGSETGDQITSTSGDDYLISLGGDGQTPRNNTYTVLADGHRVIRDEGGPFRLVFAVDDPGQILGRFIVGDTLHLVDTQQRSVLIEDYAAQNASMVFLSDIGQTVGDLAAGATVAADYFEGYGDQTITGIGSSNDLFYGLYGDDIIDAKSGDDTIFGGAGDDLVQGNWGLGWLYGGAGDDTVYGKGDADTLDGGTGDDTLSGGKGGETYIYRLGDGRDLLDDRGGEDGDQLQIEGVSSADVVFTEAGRDLLIDLPDGGRITVARHFQASGRIETISIGEDDIILGSDEGQNMFGGDGTDVIHDGAGRDGLTGGTGADTFVLATDGDADWIKDFTIGEDRIDLTAWGVSELGALDILQHSAGKAVIRYGSEILTINDGSWSLDASQLTVDSFVGLTQGGGGGTIQGTSASERLIGGSRDDVITDGAGRDGLHGRGGADTFVLVADGDADWVNDFTVNRDVLDLRAWRVEQFEDLEILQHSAGKAVIRFADEILTVNDGTWTMDASALDENNILI